MTLPTPPPRPSAAPALSWAPRPGETAVAAAGGLVMAGLGFTVDPTGRWLVWAAAALLFGIAAMDVLLRPPLRADAAGLTVRTLTGHTIAAWSQVELNLRQHQRLGRSVATLEIDIHDDLIILSRRELGTDPEAVLDQLTRLRGTP